MKRLLPLVLALLCRAPVASAAERLELLRAQAGQAGVSLAEVKARQARFREELELLGQRIQGLKAQAVGKLLPGGELDASLKRSQELSTTLTGLAMQADRAAADAARAEATLIAALTEELTGLRMAWDRGSRAERAHLVSRMRTLRAEREALRGARPAAQTPAPPLNPDGIAKSRSGLASDDPEELLEQADALRDAEDKVKKRLSALEARIVEAREERELDRRLGEFSRESALFDEQDRRLRRERNVETETALGGNPAAADMDPSKTPSSGLHLPTNPSTFAAGGGAVPHRPPQMGADGRRPEEDLSDLPALESQREAMKKRAVELEQQAVQAEAKARALSGH